jgi:hypothetical protein
LGTGRETCGRGGAHLNITVGKQDFAIPFTASDNQMRQIGVNEIIKELKTRNK